MKQELKDLYAEISNRLEQAADPERREWSRTVYPSSMKILGVKVPELKVVIKDVASRLKKESPREVVLFIKALSGSGIFEYRQLAYEVLEKHKGAMASLTLKDVTELSSGMDNWVLVDTFSGMIAGPLWRDGQLPDSFIHKWLGSENRWERRAAVVCTVALNQKARGGGGDPERTLKICEAVAADKDDMVAKALSWALRELAKRDEKPVKDFIAEYEAVLPKRVLREVRNKLNTGKKY